MDAPLYLPAATFIQPQRILQPLSSAETPITALQANGAAWAVVEKEILGIDQRIGGDQIRSHLGNFSLASLLPFGIVQCDALERIDQQLHATDETQ